MSAMPTPSEKPQSEGDLPVGLVERLRVIHLQMVEAVLAGDGLDQVAGLAADAARAPVAIVIPRLGAGVLIGATEKRTPALLETLTRYVADRVKDRPAQVPEGLVLEVPIASGDEVVGAVVMLDGPDAAVDEAAEYLHLAAVASLTEVAIEEAKEEVEQNLRGSFLEDLRSRPDLEPREIVRRAARLGCDLSRGAVVLCAELTNYLRPKIKLECVVADSDVQTIVDTVLKHGRTGAVGDGKVFVLPCDEAYRVRTGESGEEILQAHPDAAAATA
jgi:hypothetical protein